MGRIGQSMALVKDENSMLWVWGMNKKGELGVGDTADRVDPYPLFSLQGKPIKAFSIGS